MADASGSTRGRPGALRPRRALGWPRAAVAALGLGLAACAPALTSEWTDTAAGRFDFDRDTFAFANMVRAEHPGRADVFANYCIVMARAATQFFRFARFAPDRAPLPAGAYTALVQQVLAIDPWDPPRREPERVVIPGYPDLRTLSWAQEAAVKAAFGSNILSMMHWRTWRVGVRLSADHQRGVAEELVREMDARRPAPLMITNFPDADLLNHAVLVYDYRRRSGMVEFLAYDPNDPGTPLGIHFDPPTSGFWVGELPYSPPGKIRAFRLFGSPLL
jgi:hypothetical protein